MQSTSSRRIQWRQVALCQDFTSILLTVLIVLGLVITEGVSSTSSRPYYVWDATISMPYNSNSTIPYWLVPIVPLLSLIISMVVFEYAMIHLLGHSPTTAMAISLQFLLDFIGSGAITILITDITKLAVGRLRPDFLSRCQPSPPPAGDLQIAFGEPASDNPNCLSGQSQSTISDGHKSFPSGHASTAASLGLFVACYVLWSAYWRVLPRSASTKQHTACAGGSTSGVGSPNGLVMTATTVTSMSLKRRLMFEVSTTGSFLFALFQIAWAWGVGVSRIVDFKHHPSDVVAGLFLGSLIALSYFSRSIARSAWVVGSQEERNAEPLLSPSALSSSAPSYVVHGSSGMDVGGRPLQQGIVAGSLHQHHQSA